MSAHRFVSRHHLFLTGAAVAAGLMASAPAFAQPDSAETGTEADDQTAEQEDADIVVTASLREERLIEVPFSVNAQTEQDIQRSGAVTLEDISRNVAGLAVQNLGPGQSQVSIRGVSAGQVVRDQPGVKEQVGVYLDDSVISLSLFTPDLDLFDLNRVETLRGPQGTLFGSGSVGGTVRYITNQPRLGATEGLFEANANLVDGESLGWALRAAVNMPIADIAALRIVGYHTQYGGFIDARREGGGYDENINDGVRSGIRVALRIEPAENLSITPRIVYQHIRSNGFNRQEVYNLYANPFTTTRPAVTFGEREQFLLLDERFEDDTMIADLTGRFGFGGVELTTVTSYTNRDILVSRDASALTGSVTVDLAFAPAAVLLPSNLVDTTDLETFSQELRLGSATEGPFQWVVGLFYSDTDRLYSQRLPTPGYDAFTDARFGAGTSVAVANGFPSNSPYNADLPYNIEQQAVFGEASFDLGDRFTITAGGRYYDFSEVREFNSGGLFSNGDNNRDETSSNGFSPRLIATYEIADDVRVNAQAAHGFRLGGVNDPLNIPLCSGGANGIDAQTYGNRPTYDDETLWNYELNVRGQRSGITFHTAAFYTDIRNLQVTADAGTCSSRVVFNVPRAHSMGVEFELSASPARGLGFSLAGSLIEAEFDSTVTTTGGTVIAGMREGNRLPSVPRFQVSANTSYTFDLGDDGEAYVGASAQHVGSRYTQPGDQENNPRVFTHGLPFGGAPASAATTVDLRLPSYNLLNLSAGIDWDSGFSLMAYITNVLDENPLLSFDRERGGRARLGFQVGQPRTFGITARKRF